MWGPRARTIAGTVLVGMAALVAALVVARGQAGYFVSDTGVTKVQDFASHLVFTRGVWQRTWRGPEASSAYAPDAHLRIMSEWTGTDVTEALPFGYSPTMLWLLLPLCLLPVPVAYVCWAMASGAAAAWAVTRDGVQGLLAMMVFLSPIALGALALGQTGILGAAGVLFLVNRTLADHGEVSERPRAVGLGPWPGLTVVLWALSAKPPVAIAAGTALLALRKGRVVAEAVGLAALTAAVATPFLGASWVGDYLHLTSHYDRVAADPAFGWSLVPEHMSNLRSFLSVDLGAPDDRAASVSNLAWLVSSALVVLAGRRRWLDAGPVWGLAILSYLLFCSHVSSTDELLLVVVPAAVAPWRGRTGGVGAEYLPWVAVAAGLLLSPALGPAAGVRPSLLWVLELGLAAWVLVTGGRGRALRLL